LQVCREPDGVDGYPGLAGEVLQQAEVARRERLLAGAWGEPQLSDLLSPVEERQAQRIFRGRAGRSDGFLLPSERDGRVGELERLLNGPDYGGQHGFRRKRRLQALPEAGDHRVRVVSIAVHHAVHGPLQTIAYRSEDHGHDARGDEGDVKVALRLEHRAQVADHEHVDADDDGGQSAIDQGAVYEEVYVVEAVAQDRDADGHVEASEGCGLEDGVPYAGQVPAEEAGEDEAPAEQGGGVGEPFDLLPLHPGRVAIAEHQRELREERTAEDHEHPRDDQRQDNRPRRPANGKRVLDRRHAALARHEGAEEQAHRTRRHGGPRYEPPARRRQPAVREEQQEERREGGPQHPPGTSHRSGRFWSRKPARESSVLDVVRPERQDGQGQTNAEPQPAVGVVRAAGGDEPAEYRDADEPGGRDDLSPPREGPALRQRCGPPEEDQQQPRGRERQACGAQRPGDPAGRRVLLRPPPRRCRFWSGAHPLLLRDRV
jgi:hypothetical protein